MSTISVDARGMVCPLPIIKLSKAVKEIEAGQRLEIRADDPAFEPDITAWCQKMGHTLIALTREGTDIVAVVEKK